MTTTSEPIEHGDHQPEIQAHVDAVIRLAGLEELQSLAAIIDRVVALRGKPIRLEQVGDAEWGTLTGLWVETAELSRIFTRRTDPVTYQVVCALHEVMHILLDHPNCQPGIMNRPRFSAASMRGAALV